jgi:O-acetyl-ADP-ribose deacetylase (regulator of RNase III)
MIRKKGDLFSTTASAIGHGVNTQGVMGSGIAVLFKEKFPKNYQTYHNACKMRLLLPGETLIFKEDGRFITNIASQEKTGRNATYNYLMTAATDAALQLNDVYNIKRLAIPLIGCGIGGLEWEGVEVILKAVEIIVPGFEFEVWKL